MKRQKEPALTAKEQKRGRTSHGSGVPAHGSANSCDAPSIPKASTSCSRGGSALARLLLRDCLWAELSPQKMQKYCQAALEDGIPEFADIVLLANLGTHGMHSQNVWAELKSKLVPGPISSSLKTLRLLVN